MSISALSLALASALIAAIAVPVSAGEASPPERIALWGGHAPIDATRYEQAEAWITVYRPVHPNGTAAVICPGGGYGSLSLQPEGIAIAPWLADHGITGIVLEYRLPSGRHFVPLSDAQRALRTVRARAGDWGIDPRRIGVMGFSAGGHLAASAGTHCDDGDPGSADPIARVGCRPDFMILVYPVITMGALTNGGTHDNLLGREPQPDLVALFSNELQVGATTPPTFLAHAQDDTVVSPENSVMFRDALIAHHVPVRYLALPSGGHGFGYQGPMWEAWQQGALAWLAELGLVPTAR